MRELIFATHNQHKSEEVARMIGDLYNVKDLSQTGIDEDIPETGNTLEANARQKALYVYDRLGASVFADDTGLEVEALGGQPGVITARYAGPECDSVKNMQKLLAELENEDNRRAQFRTVICLKIGESEYLFEGVVKGTITRKFSGKEGFGYDPIFMPDGYNQTFAEMSMEEKNKISHRGRAVEKLVKFLRQIGDLQ
ncbi:MAG: RdgB/HAM1 family non-canonical purine NTP pyrophosphatase [Salinivirgaceae bacterium]|nr:RdgB/HAM1 family non-canonical purine NTP pyrophosphatase [Salinivirgaceae bacterium]